MLKRQTAFLANNVSGTMLRFIVDLSYVFPYNPESKQLASSEEENSAYDGGESLNGIPKYQSLAEDIYHIADGEERYDES